MIPPIADSDPDPTTHIPWPARNQVDQPLETSRTPSGRQLTSWDLITLSISMAGAQIAWTVELGQAIHPVDARLSLMNDDFRYGTPFLLSLGLSEHLTSLVWLAGPVSGLVAQPVIGKQMLPFL